MNTTGIFWIATIVLTVVAFAFIGLPLAKNNRKAPLLVVALFVPVLAAGMYLFLGSPDVPLKQDAARALGGASTSMVSGQSASNKVGSVASMVDGLVERLEQNPDDGENWLLLARTYKYLNRNDEAAAAYEKAAALGQVDAELAALAGADLVSSNSAAQIFGNLSLAQDAAALVRPDDTVFIFARAVEGPSMPLAVLQRRASDLPIDFLLNDSQSISPEMKLSDFDEVVVTARVSRSGVATDALKGLEAKSDKIVIAENRHLKLTIK